MEDWALITGKAVLSAVRVTDRRVSVFKIIILHDAAMLGLWYNNRKAGLFYCALAAGTARAENKK
jgi:hypothetical protein